MPSEAAAFSVTSRGVSYTWISSSDVFRQITMTITDRAAVETVPDVCR